MPVCVCACGQSGLTPLHVAAFVGSESMVSYLLDKGADVTSVTQRGETPLHYAARAAQPGVMKLLLDNGADVDAKSKARPLLWLVLSSEITFKFCQ